MPPREEDIDYMCANCGTIKKGPHAGEIVPESDRGHISQYKGAEVSDSMCDDCAKKWVSESKQAQATNPYWRKLGKKS